MSTSTSALLSAFTTDTANTKPTIVETVEEAAFILEENPNAAILIRPKSVQF